MRFPLKLVDGYSCLSIRGYSNSYMAGGQKPFFFPAASKVLHSLKLLACPGEYEKKIEMKRNLYACFCQTVNSNGTMHRLYPSYSPIKRRNIFCRVWYPVRLALPNWICFGYLACWRGIPYLFPIPEKQWRLIGMLPLNVFSISWLLLSNAWSYHECLQMYVYIRSFL